MGRYFSKICHEILNMPSKTLNLLNSFFEHPNIPSKDVVIIVTNIIKV